MKKANEYESLSAYLKLRTNKKGQCYVYGMKVYSTNLEVHEFIIEEIIGGLEWEVPHSSLEYQVEIFPIPC